MDDGKLMAAIEHLEDPSSNTKHNIEYDVAVLQKYLENQESALAEFKAKAPALLANVIGKLEASTCRIRSALLAHEMRCQTATEISHDH